MSKFSETVLQIVSAIPYGQVASYGQVATYAGIPRGARQVGWILMNNSEEIPWWRVINNAGRISIKNPFITPDVQRELLEKEAVEVDGGLNIDIERYRWNPDRKTLQQFNLQGKYLDNLIQRYGL